MSTSATAVCLRLVGAVALLSILTAGFTYAQAFADVPKRLVDYAKAEENPAKACDAMGQYKAKEIVSIQAVEIQAISFDRRSWWRWPWEIPPGERAGDDPGEFARAQAARDMLDRYLLGEISADLCVRSFGHLGLELAPDSDTDATDDAGPEEAAPSDATEDVEAQAGGSTDDPGEAAPYGG